MVREGGVVAAASGRGAAWLARYNGVVEVPGSNPGAPTKRQLPGCLFCVRPVPFLSPSFRAKQSGVEKSRGGGRARSLDSAALGSG